MKNALHVPLRLLRVVCRHESKTFLRAHRKLSHHVCCDRSRQGKEYERMNMKLQIKMLVAALAIASSAAYLVAQDNSGQPPHRGGGPEGHRMPPPPLFAALDANHDGVIDESEIDNAPAA